MKIIRHILNVFIIITIFIMVTLINALGQDFQNSDLNKQSITSMIGLGEGSNLKISNVSDSNILSASINENEYYVDAGDVFLIKIDVKGPAFKMFNSVVTPTGFLVIPDAPSIYVKYLVLSDAKSKINQFLKRTFPNATVESYLYYIHPIRVTVLGAVPNPVKISLYSNHRLFDAVNSAFITTEMDTNNIFDWRTISYRNIDLIRNGKAKKETYDLLKYKIIGDKSQNPYLMDEDILYIQYKDSTKYSIGVNGAIAQPIEFEFIYGDNLKNALQFAGGLLPTADSSRIELLRFKKNKFDVDKISLSFPKDSSFNLETDDRIYIREKYNYHQKYSVQLEGAVKYPGEYPINEGKSKLTQIIEQAGGFSQKASLRNARLLRAKNIFEDKELNRLKKMTVTEMNDVEVSYFRLRSREDTRLVSCNFENLFIEKEMAENVVLHDGDIIIIPEITKTIFVSGGIISPGHINLAKDRNYLDYIILAGGFNDRAREGNVKIIKNKSGVWLDAEKDILIEEGDIIFIPENEEIDWLEALKEGLTMVTQVGTIVLIIINLQK